MLKARCPSLNTACLTATTCTILSRLSLSTPFPSFCPTSTASSLPRWSPVRFPPLYRCTSQGDQQEAQPLATTGVPDCLFRVGCEKYFIERKGHWKKMALLSPYQPSHCVGTSCFVLLQRVTVLLMYSKCWTMVLPWGLLCLDLSCTGLW